MTREEAIKIVKEFINGTCLHLVDQEALETLIPELRESEDERIRKEMIDFLKSEKAFQTIDLPISERWIAWLEKQKDSVPVEKYIQDIADAFEDGRRKGLEKQKEQNLELYYDKELDNAAREFYLSGGADSPIDSTGLVPIVRMAEFGATWMKERMEKEQKHILKFKVGDKVHLEGDDVNILTITGIEKDRYLTDCAYGPILFGAEDIWQIVEQKPADNPKWTELTWKDIVELEGIINNVHYDFRNGIGQESFGKEVLERFRESKGEEYMDAEEPKPFPVSDSDKAVEMAYEKGYRLGISIGREENKQEWKPSEEQMKALESCGMCNKDIYSLYEELKKL